jgi:hypothetical protein
MIEDIDTDSNTITVVTQLAAVGVCFGRAAAAKQLPVP